MINICKFDRCGIIFKSLADLIQHIEENHIGNSKFHLFLALSNHWSFYLYLERLTPQSYPYSSASSHPKIGFDIICPQCHLVKLCLYIKQWNYYMIQILCEFQHHDDRTWVCTLNEVYKNTDKRYPLIRSTSYQQWCKVLFREEVLTVNLMNNYLPIQ